MRPTCGHPLQVHNDTVDYAMDRNGEALAKTITKLKGR